MLTVDTKDKYLSEMKKKLDDNMLVTEKHLTELRMATDLEMGKIRMLGLEVISSLASVRNAFILLLNTQLSNHQRLLVEKIAAKSIEWELELDLNQDRKKDFVKWRQLDQNWVDIVTSIGRVVEDSYTQEMDILVITSLLRNFAVLESEISLHLEFQLSGRSEHGNQDHKLAIRHIQEYEDRLNSAQGNRVYQRHVRKSKSFRVKSGEDEKENHRRAKYQRSRTADLATISNTSEVKQTESTKSNSLLQLEDKKSAPNHTSNTSPKHRRQRKSSFMDQVTHILKHIL